MCCFGFQVNARISLFRCSIHEVYHTHIVVVYTLVTVGTFGRGEGFLGYGWRICGRGRGGSRDDIMIAMKWY